MRREEAASHLRRPAPGAYRLHRKVVRIGRGLLPTHRGLGNGHVARRHRHELAVIAVQSLALEDVVHFKIIHVAVQPHRAARLEHAVVEHAPLAFKFPLVEQKGGLNGAFAALMGGVHRLQLLEMADHVVSSS